MSVSAGSIIALASYRVEVLHELGRTSDIGE
jgi:hypothetical protein